MFNFLKEKLGNWLNKLHPGDNEEKPVKKPVKKVQKKELKKKAKDKVSVKEVGKKILEDIRKEEGTGSQKIKKQYEAEEVKEELETEKKEKGGFFSKLFGKKAEEVKEEKQKTGFFDIFRSRIDENKFEEIFSELELTLIQNNVAIQAIDEIKKSLKEEIVGKLSKEIDIRLILRKAIERLLINPPNTINIIKEKLKEKKPFVAILVGINGSGKTTTIAKFAHLLKKAKLSVCLAAADTFRAASIEQISQHAERLGIPLIKKEYGSDPASVGFEAISYAKKHNIDVVLIDTAGRMNTKDSLIKEMEKIVRVCQPDLKIFIGESITGNDATEQAKTFNESINLDGIILSKADVDEKGGTAISISKVTGKPILFLGTGQSYEDLEVFDKEELIKKLGLS